MIKRLRLRMTLLVIGVLIVVSVGIVLAIYEVNNRSIIAQVESALDTLAENSGVRPSRPEMDPGIQRNDGETPPPKPDGEEEGETPPPRPEDEAEDGTVLDAEPTSQSRLGTRRSGGGGAPPDRSESEFSGNQMIPEEPQSMEQPPPSKPEDPAMGQTPPDKPEETSADQIPPEKPEAGSAPDQTPPDKPTDESPMEQTPPEKPEGEPDEKQPPAADAEEREKLPETTGSGNTETAEEASSDSTVRTSRPTREGNPPGGDPGSRRTMTSEEVASLSNYYTMTLDEDGQIQSWQSDRADLYNQDTLQGFADLVLSTGQTSGRFDTQFFRLVDQEDGTRLLIVLDARLEMAAGWQVLRTTALVAGIACLVLSLGAWLLIRRMVRPVEEAFTKQQQFVWDASHELKTPLAVISANADVLESDIGENEHLGYIRSEVKRTDSLVKNLLTLARMDRGTADQEMKEMNLSEAVLGVLLPFESTVFEAGKTLKSEIQDQVMISGNEAMLQQLTVILLSNALKYSDDHGVISVRLEKKGRGVELRVMNTGNGIAARDLERIFDRFYRTDASRNSETGGEGLGLAIAKSIVDIHHGKIRAESAEGKSATFIVNLP